MNKKCNTCKFEKPVGHFGNRAASKDGLAGWCKQCKQAYDLAYYVAKDRRSAIAANTKQRMHEIKVYVWNYLLAHPCVDCGESDPVVLEFDHKDPSTKLRSIAEMVAGRFGLNKIRAEIAKCEVRCANCHRRKTATQFGWHALMGC